MVVRRLGNSGAEPSAKKDFQIEQFGFGFCLVIQSPHKELCTEFYKAEWRSRESDLPDST